MARTSNTMLNKTGKSENPVIVSWFRGNAFNYSLWNMKLAVGLSCRCWFSFTKSCLTLCDPMNCSMQTPLASTISQSLLRFMSIKLMMLTNNLILCWPLLLLPSIFPSIRVFSSESAVYIRWPKYWSFSFLISPSSEYSGLISFRIFFFFKTL